MDSTSGHGICRGHHGRHGNGWGYGFGRRDTPQDSIRLRAAQETKLSSVVTASATEATWGVAEAGSEEMTTASLRYERQEKTSLVIRTQEGDLVKLRFAEREAMAFDDTSVATDDAEASETTLSLRTSTKVSVRIRGDLNEDELAAIRSVIEQAGKLATEFFDGDAGQAFAMANELAIDGQQLAKVALRMRVREALTYDGSQTRVDIPALAGPASSPAAIVNAHDRSALDDAAAAAADGEAVAGTDVETGAETGVEVDAATPGVTGSPEGGAAAVPANTATDATESDPASLPAEQAATTQASQSGVADPFAALRSMIEFLTRLIETFESGSAQDAEAEQAPDETGAAAPAGDNAPATAATETSLSFSLKLRMFVSVVTTLAAVEPTAGEPAGDDAAAENTASESGASDNVALTTLTEAVETIAAESEPGCDIVA